MEPKIFTIGRDEDTLSLEMQNINPDRSGFFENSISHPYKHGQNRNFIDDDAFDDQSQILERSMQIELERVSMKLEDSYGFIQNSKITNEDRAKMHDKSKDDSKNESDIRKGRINSTNQEMLIGIECRLAELYQFKEDIELFIKRVENESNVYSNIYFGGLKLNIKVITEDSPFPTKKYISQEVSNNAYRKFSEKGTYLNDFSFLDGYFNTIEEDMTNSFKHIKSDIFFIKGATEEFSSKFIVEMQKYATDKFKAGEASRLKEVEWHMAEIKSKKSNYNDKIKLLEIKESDLQRFSKRISEQTVKNVKESENLECMVEDFEARKYNQELLFNKKIEYINEALQIIEDSKCEVLSPDMKPPTQEPIMSPKKVTDDIKTLENKLMQLEKEYKTSRVPENLESLQTSMNRIKNSLLNLKSLNVLQKNERTSSAIRNNLNRMDKPIDNSTDFTNSRNSLASNHSDTNLKLHKKLPHNLLPASIRISPLRKLEISTSKVNVSELNPHNKRKSSLTVMESPRNDLQASKHLRVKELILREREEELEIEEKKLQEIWSNTPQGREMIPVLQQEVFEYRKMRQELYHQRDALAKDQEVASEKIKRIELKEGKIKAIKKDLVQQKIKFELEKKPVAEKLDWLKNMLMENL